MIQNDTLIMLAATDLHIEKKSLAQSLRTEGYDVVVVKTPEALETWLSKDLPDLVLIGFASLSSNIAGCSAVRLHYQVPILILSEIDVESTKVQFFDDLKVDDYVVKPVGLRELLARVRALLRRASLPKNGMNRKRVQGGALTVDVELRQATLHGKSLGHLTPTEFKLLYYLVDHWGLTLTYAMILKNVWEQEAVTEEGINSIRPYISSLRKKIKAIDPLYSRCIVTEAGVGYRVTTPEEQ